MPKSFLGKRPPKSHPPRAKRRASSAWFALLAVPILAAGTLVSLQRQQLLTETGPRTTGGALSRIVADFSDTHVTTKDTQEAATQAEAEGTKLNPCDQPTGVTANGKNLNQVSEAFRREFDPTTKKATGVAKDVVIFPIIPDGIRGVNREGITDTENWCSQGFWTRNVVYWFGYKFLALLNWFATALAILLSLYAALLYMSGFANEANVKKAKGILIGTYVGLAIVFLARVIVHGSINIISGETITNISTPVEVENQ